MKSHPCVGSAKKHCLKFDTCIDKFKSAFGAHADAGCARDLVGTIDPCVIKVVRGARYGWRARSERYGRRAGFIFAAHLENEMGGAEDLGFSP